MLSTMTDTKTRVPRRHARRWQTAGFTLIRSRQFCIGSFLTRFSLQRYHRRLGDMMVGLGGDPYLETVAWSARACLNLTLVVKTIGRSGGGLENRRGECRNLPCRKCNSARSV